jgi:hypothetical protein
MIILHEKFQVHIMSIGGVDQFSMLNLIFLIAL